MTADLISAMIARPNIRIAIYRPYMVLIRNIGTIINHYHSEGTIGCVNRVILKENQKNIFYDVLLSFHHLRCRKKNAVVYVVPF